MQNTSCIRKPQVMSGGVRTPCTLPLDPPLLFVISTKHVLVTFLFICLFVFVFLSARIKQICMSLGVPLSQALLYVHSFRTLRDSECTSPFLLFLQKHSHFKSKCYRRSNISRQQLKIQSGPYSQVR